MNISEAAKVLGKKGGDKNKNKPKKFWQKLQELGVEAKKRKKQELLSKFTVEDALNPITVQSIGEKMEQIEYEDKN